jgi:hypothetical protein
MLLSWLIVYHGLRFRVNFVSLFLRLTAVAGYVGTNWILHIGRDFVKRKWRKFSLSHYFLIEKRKFGTPCCYSSNSMGENMKKYSRIVLSMIFVLALVIAAMAADPFAGTWKLNVAKSKFSSPAPKSEIITIAVRKNGSTWTFDTVDADGMSSHMEWSGIYDGKDHPVTGDPNGDTAATRKIDANTIISVGKKGEKTVDNMQIVVSQDGKTMTLNQKVKNQQRQDINNTCVFDKQ